MKKPNKKPTLAASGKRVGAFSNEERNFILDNLDKTDEYIGEKLLRNEVAVSKERRKLILNKNLKPKLNDEATEEEEALTILKLKPTWESWKHTYTAPEIKMAEYQWVKLYKQFRGDMLHSEETQVFKLIDIEILIQRGMKEKKDSLEEIEKLEREIAETRKTVGKNERQQVIELQQIISSLKSARAANDKSYNDLLGRHRELMIQLKGTREQRIKQIEEGKKTFFDWIKALNDDDYRAAESRRAELFTVAMQKEKTRLSNYHTFDDGMVDQPVLSSDTILDDNIDKDLEQEAKDG
jgi:hypothetical protein